MKVLILAENHRSIPARYWETSVPILRERGIDVRFATVQAGGPLHDTFSKMGIPATAFGSRRAVDYPKVTAALRALLKQESVDIIHASEAIAATISGLACLSLPGTKSIFHYHHVRLEGKQRMLSRVGSRLADLVMNVSAASQAGAIEFDHVPLHKTRVAYNGTVELRHVDEQEVAKLRSDLAIGPGHRAITIVGRLRREKGYPTLFAAAGALARSTDHPLHLIVAGDGPHRSELEQLAAAMPEVRVHFLGHQDDVAPWFALADVVAVPSYIEAFGLTAVEAMSAGKPVVATRVGGLTEIIGDRVDGLLVEPHDVDGMASAISEILTNRDLAVELGARARETYLQRFTVERMVDGWIDCYSSLNTINI